MKRDNPIILLLSAMLLLGGCKSETAFRAVDAAPSDNATSGPIIGPRVPADVLGGWFVRRFDSAALERIRNTAAFAAQNISYTLIPPKGSGLTQDRHVASNAYRDIGVDHARSVGLTGKGVTISIVDSPVNVQHADFAGKKMIAAKTPTVLDSAAHGTGVAGVAAGRRGVAPRARLHHAAISFQGGMKLSTLAQIMRDASAKGALVSNNSWALTATVAGNRNSPLLSQYASGRDYLQSLRNFTEKGIVVFAATNSFSDRSAHLMAGLPALYPELEQGWLAVINAIPARQGGRVRSATRVSAGCLEAARWCIAANGQVKAPSSFDLDGYQIAKGASFAAPQISGALALLAEAFPDLTPAELRARLLVTADNGFFRHDGVVKFAPGLRHGYSREWGHGFADLRAALLPIGKITTPGQSGKAIEMQDAVAVAGTAMGDGLAQGLGKARVVINDQMLGVFAVPAATMVKTRPRRASTLLSGMMAQEDLRTARSSARRANSGDIAAALRRPGTLVDSGSYSIERGYDIHLTRTGDYRVSAILSEGTDQHVGLSASRIFAGGGAGFEFGFEAIREAGSVIGMRAARSGGASHHLALTANAALALTDNAVLRVGGKIGRASGARVGEIIDVGDQTFDSMNLSLSLSGSAVRDDVLTFFLNRPVAVRTGSAIVSLAHPTAAGDIEFSKLSVDTAPLSRQVDLGLEYMRPFGTGSEIAFAVWHVENQGNIAGRTETEVGFRISRRS